MDKKELLHWGIKGQKWGRRRFQNQDGSLTPAGEKRYGVGDGDNDKSSGDFLGPNAKTVPGRKPLGNVGKTKGSSGQQSTNTKSENNDLKSIPGVKPLYNPQLKKNIENTSSKPTKTNEAHDAILKDIDNPRIKKLLEDNETTANQTIERAKRRLKEEDQRLANGEITEKEYKENVNNIHKSTNTVMENLNSQYNSIASNAMNNKAKLSDLDSKMAEIEKDRETLAKDFLGPDAKTIPGREPLGNVGKTKPTDDSDGTTKSENIDGFLGPDAKTVPGRKPLGNLSKLKPGDESDGTKTTKPEDADGFLGPDAKTIPGRKPLGTVGQVKKTLDEKDDFSPEAFKAAKEKQEIRDKIAERNKKAEEKAAKKKEKEEAKAAKEREKEAEKNKKAEEKEKKENEKEREEAARKKSAEELREESRKLALAGNITTTAGNAIKNQGVDIARQVRKMKNAKELGDYESMSTKELKEATDRMVAENNYVNAKMAKTTAAQQRLESGLSIFGSVLSVAGAGLSLAAAWKKYQSGG